MNLSRNNILTIVLVLVLLATAYIWYGYFTSKPPESAVGSASGEAAQLGNESNEFLMLLGVLKGIKMDTAFFENPLFLGLKDAVTLEDIGAPGAPGRPNPFQPIR